MAESFIDKSSKIVPDTVKQTIGKLIVVVAGTSEPAMKIHFTSALITHIRSALYYIFNNTDMREFDDVLHETIYNILKSEYDPDAIQFAYRRMKKLFQDKPRTKWDVMLFNDIALIQQCRNNWRGANAMYFENTDAWLHSNEALADINDVLVEVAIRWNLVIIPKEQSFNISQIPNVMIPQMPSGGGGPLDH